MQLLPAAHPLFAPGVTGARHRPEMPIQLAAKACGEMHVLILNQTFYPDVASTGQLMWDLARHLDVNGHRVTVVTSSYFYGSTQAHARRRETIGNIGIVRVRQTGFGKKHLIGRLFDFASFYVTAGWQLIDGPRPDVILALTSPPMISTLAGLARQFLSKPDGSPVRFVYHVMDLYPDAAIAPGVIGAGSLPARLFARLTERTLRLADAVIVLGRDMRDRVLKNYPRGASADRIHVVQPWAESEMLSPLEKTANPLAVELRLVDSFNVVYSGNLGIAHDLETMVRGIEQTRDDQSIKWIFIGGGKRFDQLKSLAKEQNWPNIMFLPFQDREKLNFSLNLADVHLISQQPSFTGVVVPSKLFGVLAVGKPSLMIGPAEAEVSRIIDENRVGFVVENGQAARLVDRIHQLQQDANLRDEMGRRARAVFEQKFDRDTACTRIEEILKGVVDQAGDRGRVCK